MSRPESDQVPAVAVLASQIMSLEGIESFQDMDANTWEYHFETNPTCGVLAVGEKPADGKVVYEGWSPTDCEPSHWSGDVEANHWYLFCTDSLVAEFHPDGGQVMDDFPGGDPEQWIIDALQEERDSLLDKQEEDSGIITDTYQDITTVMERGSSAAWLSSSVSVNPRENR